ncbi:hypothetical protein BKA70DRAFT_1262588 [Coprinopsis sp. MPI-PUGE-AT-0042]|nr:hypothetical protein BKA70DRAFT_1262588 [Coprinopsis sp. MPI-PUGE-AT-0042]
MNELPVEIWALVVTFLEDGDLHRVRGVNRALYDLASDRRYKEVSLDLRDRAGMNLVGQPRTAPRIRHLAIQIWNFTPFYVYAPSTAASNTQSSPSLRGKLKRLLAKWSRPSQHQVEVVSVESSLQKLKNILPLMQRVDNLHLSIRYSASTGVGALLSTAWSVFGSNLHRLSLRIDAQSWEAFSESQPFLPSLKTLEIELVHVSFLGESSRDLGVYVKGVARFMNSLSSTVQTLKLRSSYGYGLDLAMFFSHLEPIPLLHSLSLRIPFTINVQEDPSSLTSFLLRCSRTLKNADIRISVPPEASRIAYGALQVWMADVTSNPLCLSQLRSLEIQPTGLKVVQQCISNNFAHLASLTILGNCILPTSAVLQLCLSLSLCHQLTFLRFDIGSLDCEIFDALSRHLPKLHCLWLTAHIFTETRLQFLSEMEVLGRYQHWELRDLTICEGYIGPDAASMHACSRAIPSLRSVGQGALYQTSF